LSSVASRAVRNEHDQIGAEIVDRELGRTSGRDLLRVESFVAKGRRDRVGDRRLVVDDEDARQITRVDSRLGHLTQDAT
jgi:hypothetical protein